MESQWDEYIGVAASNIGNSDRILEVICPEALPFVNGNNITPEIESVTIQVDDEVQGKISKTVKIGNAITADYLGGTNESIPNIHIGEEIKLLNYAGTDKYFWLPTGRNDSMRRFERRKIRVANIDVSNKELTDENTYFLDMQTNEGCKHIILQTSTSDGERFLYRFKIDAKENQVTFDMDGLPVSYHMQIDGSSSHVMFSDSMDNIFEINSLIQFMEMRNKSQTRFNIFGPNSNLIVPGHFNMTAKSASVNVATLTEFGTAALTGIVLAANTMVIGTPENPGTNVVTINGTDALVVTGAKTDSIGAAYNITSVGNTTITIVTPTAEFAVNGYTHLYGNLKVEGTSDFVGHVTGDNT